MDTESDSQSVSIIRKQEVSPISRLVPIITKGRSDLLINCLTIGTDFWYLPQKISGSLWLPGLTNAKDLVLPEILEEGLILIGLKDAKGLILPKGFPLESLVASKETRKEIFSHNDYSDENISEYKGGHLK